MRTKNMLVAIVVAMAFSLTTANAQSDIEFNDSFQAAKYNYGHVKKEKQPHQDLVEAYVGNDTEPTVLYSEDNHGWSLDGFGQFGTFAGHTTWGGGFGIGYRGRCWGSDVHVGFRRALEDAASDRTARFNQGQIGLRLHYNVLQWNNHHDVISLFGEVSFQLSSFLDEEQAEYTNVVTNPNGSVTTTTTTVGDLDIRQFTIGFKGGAEYEHKFKFSPFSYWVAVSDVTRIS